MPGCWSCPVAAVACSHHDPMHLERASPWFCLKLQSYCFGRRAIAVAAGLESAAVGPSAEAVVQHSAAAAGRPRRPAVWPHSRCRSTAERTADNRTGCHLTGTDSS